MSALYGTCQCGRDADGAEYMCGQCERIEEWRQGKRGEPGCPNCSGRGWYADGDALAGVQWKETCDCMGYPARHLAETGD